MSWLGQPVCWALPGARGQRCLFRRQIRRRGLRGAGRLLPHAFQEGLLLGKEKEGRENKEKHQALRVKAFSEFGCVVFAPKVPSGAAGTQKVPNQCLFCKRRTPLWECQETDPLQPSPARYPSP